MKKTIVYLLVSLSVAWAQPASTVLVSPMGLDNDYHPAVVLGQSGKSSIVRMTSGKYAGQEFVVLPDWIKPGGAAPQTAPGQAGSPQAGAPQAGGQVMASPMGLKDGYEQAVVLSETRNGYQVRFTSGKYAGQEFAVLKDWVRPAAQQAPAQQPNAQQAQPQAQPQAAQPQQPQGNDPYAQMQRDMNQTIADSKKPPTQPGPVAGATPFQGIYLRQEQSFQGTALRHREDYYYFFSDGRVYHGVPPEGPAHFSWEQEMRNRPERCGRYGVQGGRITFQWANGNSYTWKISGTGQEFDLNMSPTVKVDRFPANARLSGSYHRGSVNAAAGLPTVAKATIYHFYPDGSVTLDGMKGTDTTNVTVTIDEKARGTYSLSGQDLEIRWGGEIWRCTAFPQGAPPTSPPRVSINGALFERN